MSNPDWLCSWASAVSFWDRNLIGSVWVLYDPWPSVLAGRGVSFPVVLRFSVKGYEWTRYFGKEKCVVNIIDISSTKSKSDTTGPLNQSFFGLALFMSILYPFLKWHHFMFPKWYSSSNAFPVSLLHKLFSDYVRSQWRSSLGSIFVIHNHMINLIEMSLLIYIIFHRLLTAYCVYMLGFRWKLINRGECVSLKSFISPLLLRELSCLPGNVQI